MANNGAYGVYLLDNCHNNTISNNVANNYDAPFLSSGIMLENKCSTNTILNNTVRNNYNGICLLSDCNDNIISGNTAKYNILYGIFFTVNCDNNTISENTINDNDFEGISLNGNCNYNTISKNEIDDNDFNGIALGECNNNSILENTANYNSFVGILIQASNDNIVARNTANDNGYSGIKLNDNSKYNIISHNNASNYMTLNQRVGISLDLNSDSNTISQNNVNNNVHTSSDEGIGIYLLNGCDKNNISSNSAGTNTQYGIFIDWNCDNNNFTENIIYNNPNIGAYIDETSCQSNLFHINYFIDNGKHAVDNGLNNHWNNTFIGNYWNNYSGIDANGDGIGDIPHDIPGTAGSQDNLPIWPPAIKINTPENKTYTGPMNGYYPATYGFENDAIGSDPSGWMLDELGGNTINIIDNLEGHKNLVEFFDISTSFGPYIRQNLSSTQQYGTVEWWWRLNDTSKYSGFLLYNGLSSSNCIVDIIVTKDKFRYFNGSLVDMGITALDNKWYHMKVDFECTTGGYTGLSQFTWRVYIDGIQYGDYSFWNNEPEINMVSFDGSSTNSGYTWYVDAIGYSWDLNYSIGSNLNEGLLLSFENNTNLNWMGYSLDGQNNVTILGNTTIPMLEDGPHAIQVFGNDSLGNLYSSQLRHFKILPRINLPPICNAPADIETTFKAIETIPWILYDEFGTGFYRVLINGTPGQWTAWENNTLINYLINTSQAGHFNYTIQYYDSDGLFGIEDEVHVKIVRINLPPICNAPAGSSYLEDTPANYTEWIIYDEYGTGDYRILINRSVWVDWTPWENSTNIIVPVDTSESGYFNYTLVYYDSDGLFGNDHTVIIHILPRIKLPPICNSPADIETTVGALETIPWIVSDEFGTGFYIVLINGTPGQWNAWENNTLINHLIDTSESGYFNYTIQYYDFDGEFGIQDEVLIKIVEENGDDRRKPVIYGYNILILSISIISIIIILKIKIRMLKSS
ncbi:hypothetical protein ES703_30265 [subsurface metagenome]